MADSVDHRKDVERPIPVEAWTSESDSSAVKTIDPSKLTLHNNAVDFSNTSNINRDTGIAFPLAHDYETYTHPMRIVAHQQYERQPTAESAGFPNLADVGSWNEGASPVHNHGFSTPAREFFSVSMKRPALPVYNTQPFIPEEDVSRTSPIGHVPRQSSTNTNTGGEFDISNLETTEAFNRTMPSGGQACDLTTYTLETQPMNADLFMNPYTSPDVSFDINGFEMESLPDVSYDLSGHNVPASVYSSQDPVYSLINGSNVGYSLSNTAEASSQHQTIPTDLSEAPLNILESQLDQGYPIMNDSCMDDITTSYVNQQSMKPMQDHFSNLSHHYGCRVDWNTLQLDLSQNISAPGSASAQLLDSSITAPSVSSAYTTTTAREMGLTVPPQPPYSNDQTPPIFRFPHQLPLKKRKYLQIQPSVRRSTPKPLVAVQNPLKVSGVPEDSQYVMQLIHTGSEPHEGPPTKKKRGNAHCENKKKVEKRGGSCLRCKLLKRKCSDNLPCDSCTKYFFDSSADYTGVWWTCTIYKKLTDHFTESVFREVLIRFKLDPRTESNDDAVMDLLNTPENCNPGVFFPKKPGQKASSTHKTDWKIFMQYIPLLRYSVFFQENLDPRYRPKYSRKDEYFLNCIRVFYVSACLHLLHFFEAWFFEFFSTSKTHWGMDNWLKYAPEFLNILIQMDKFGLIDTAITKGLIATFKDWLRLLLSKRFSPQKNPRELPKSDLTASYRLNLHGEVVPLLAPQYRRWPLVQKPHSILPSASGMSIGFIGWGPRAFNFGVMGIYRM